ncbi:MAG: MurR/RpiR family transcriptional regulator [Woeseiaceae bacterium]
MLERIHQLESTFTRAEQKVAHWVTRHPYAVSGARLATVAADADVSEPTVVRFCRRIGCKGFSDFKLRWAASAHSRRDQAHAEVDLNDNAETIIRKVFNSSLRELERVMLGLNSDALQTAAASIAKADRLLFAGVGASAVVAKDAENKFFRLGLGCTALTDEPTVRQAAATCDKNQVFVAISKSGESAAMIDAMTLARRSGALGIGVTAPGSTLAKSASLALLIDAKEDTSAFTPMSSRLAQLAVLDALQVCTVIAGGAPTLKKLDASKAALQKLAY